MYQVADNGGARAPGAGARTIRSPDDAEQVAAEWMRHLGFGDAQCTGSGADGGVDVRSHGAVAQVKAQLTPVGRPELQSLYGVARSEGRQPLFFSLMSYTAAALTWADEVGMALFRPARAARLHRGDPPGGRPPVGDPGLRPGQRGPISRSEHPAGARQ